MRLIIWLTLCIACGCGAYFCWWGFLSHGLGLGGHHDPVRRAEQETKTTFWLIWMFGFAVATLAAFIGFMVTVFRRKKK